MSHLQLVPALPVQECRCERTAGRYWLAGSWHCKGTDAVIRFSATKGWHHYAGHQIIDPAHIRTNESEQAA